MNSRARIAQALRIIADALETESEVEQLSTDLSGRLLSIPQAAEYLAVSRDTVDRLVAAGELATVRVGRVVRIAQRELDAYVRRNETRLRPVSLQTRRRSGGPSTRAAR